MLEDWAYAVPYRSSANRRRQLPLWLYHHNYQHPHRSLADLPQDLKDPGCVNSTLS